MEILGILAGMTAVGLAAYRLGQGRRPPDRTGGTDRRTNDRYEAILRNINRYDGSSAGQEVIR